MLLQSTRPSLDQLKGFTQCPYKATAMLYEHIDIDKCDLSGNLLDSDFANVVPPEWESLVAKIKDIAPTNQEKDEIIRSVRQITSIHLNTVTCALCGL